MNLRENLKSRWRPEFDKHGVAVAARRHFDAALNVIDAINAKRSALAKDVSLSDIGRAQKLQELAKVEAPGVAKAMRAIDTAKSAIRAQRLALTPTVKDPSNLAAAMLRQEIRSLLRDKSASAAVAFAMAKDTDPLVIEAIFEAPTMLSNIGPVQRDQLLQIVVERTAGPQLVALSQQDEVVELLQAAVRSSTDALRDAAGVTPSNFDKWLSTVAPVSDKASAEEVTAFNAEAATKTALALPLAARMSLVESLLATNTAEIKAA